MTIQWGRSHQPTPRIDLAYSVDNYGQLVTAGTAYVAFTVSLFLPPAHDPLPELRCDQVAHSSVEARPSCP
jgi:hypothetical protein